MAECLQVPGSTITTAGTNQHMQAHGGGIFEVDNVFYLIGENKLNGSAFQSINCYSSTVSLLLPSTSTLLVHTSRAKTKGRHFRISCSGPS